MPVADDGPDAPKTVIALCPNWHCRTHNDGFAFSVYSSGQIDIG